MRDYCTLFDSKFLPQGLALYQSLERHSRQAFRLHILAMDEQCFESLKLLKVIIPYAVVTRLSLFESSYGLEEVRRSRTFQEYCWTCASTFSHWLCSRGLNEITYLDADCFMFSDPARVFRELTTKKSIAIIPHRFPLERMYMEVNGRFNVSWVTFRGKVGIHCLELWASQCVQWCYYRNEEGRFGDQKYLDKWPSLYGDECVQIKNIGVGAAPWNVSQYKVAIGREGLVCLDSAPLVFYHFHEFVPWKRLTNYSLRDEDKTLIYGPYVKAVDAAQRELWRLS